MAYGMQMAIRQGFSGVLRLDAWTTYMIYPNVSDYEDHRSYFDALIKENKASNKNFSHRFFARKAQWPQSYLSDIVNGHKKFTLVRALQFAKMAKFNLWESERVVLWCLKDSGDSLVRAFAEEILRAQGEKYPGIK